MTPSRMNNMRIKAQRKDIVYETVLADLVLMGKVSKPEFEAYTGKAFPATLKPLELAKPEAKPEPTQQEGDADRPKLKSREK